MDLDGSRKEALVQSDTPGPGVDALPWCPRDFLGIAATEVRMEMSNVRSAAAAASIGSIQISSPLIRLVESSRIPRGDLVAEVENVT